MFAFHFDDEVDYFELDPVAYASALGTTGVSRLRSRIDALRIETSGSGSGERSVQRGRTHVILEWFERRFAILDRDTDAIIRTHLRDGRAAAWHDDVAQAFEEIGEIDLAIEWAQRATHFDLGYQAQRAAEHWWQLLDEHQPHQRESAAQAVFNRWPTSRNGERLVGAAGPSSIGSVASALEPHAAELVRFQLGVLRDPVAAWASAHRLVLTNDGVWAKLASAYLPIDTVAALRVQLRLLYASLERADTGRYRPAARALADMRRTAATASGIEALTLVDEAIATLRARYVRRPRLIEELDRAKLPRNLAE